MGSAEVTAIEEWNDQHPVNSDLGCRRLWAEVILDAYRQATTTPAHLSPAAETTRQDNKHKARSWFRGQDFTAVAAMAAVSASQIKDALELVW